MGFLDGFLNQRPDENNKTAAAAEVEPEAKPINRGAPISADEKQKIKSLSADKISEIFDPEIPVNIYELGLIYDIDVNDFADVVISMTLTSPHCPVAETMPGEVEVRVREVAGIGDVQVALVWEPPWDMSMMSEAARLEMGFM